MTSNPTNDIVEPRRSSELSGRWVVVGLFAFGVVMASSLWIYWDLQTAPFRKFQDALAVEFPRSRPRVDGGKPKVDRPSPRLLRVVLGVSFDPTSKDSRIQPMVRRVEELARQYQDVTIYDVLEVHLYWAEPEKDIKQHTVSVPLRQ